jgi:2-polyprenyl-3-methyl-5-hydroxy-6-metoxy-1,4-benzoquinol methylase
MRKCAVFAVASRNIHRINDGMLAMLSLSEFRTGAIDDFLAYWLANALLPEDEQKTFDDYYHSYKRHFGPYVRCWYARQSRELTEMVRSRAALRVLEIGCGCGTEALWAAVLGADVTGIDISPHLLAVAKARLGLIEQETRERLRCRFLPTSVLEVDETHPFDVIFLEQAFHHLEPRADVVAKLSRLVVPGGHIILSESNGWNPFLQAVLFKLRGTKTIIHHMGHIWGNERITVPAAVIRNFRPYRVEPARLQYFRVFPNIPLADSLRFVDRALPSYFKPLFTHYNLVLKRQSSS